MLAAITELSRQCNAASSALYFTNLDIHYYCDPESLRELRVESVTDAEVQLMNGRELVSFEAIGDGTYRNGEITITAGSQGEGMACQ